MLTYQNSFCKVWQLLKLIIGSLITKSVKGHIVCTIVIFTFKWPVYSLKYNSERFVAFFLSSRPHLGHHIINVYLKL